MYVVDVCHYTHTCPADPEPHTVDTRQTIVSTVDGGPCRQPQHLASGVVVDCRRRLPTDRQCPACRPVIVVRSVTVVDWGPEPTPVRPARTGVTTDPCPICGLPLAAVLADLGMHLLCRPTWLTFPRPRHRPVSAGAR